MRSMSSTASSVAAATMIKASTSTLIVATSAYTCFRVYRDFQWGGHDWKQGDWLINNHGQQVRRGPLGSVLISIGDLIGVSPLAVVTLVQIAVMAALAGILLAALSRLPKGWVYSIIAFSPAFFLVSWVANDQSAVRKEMIVYLAMSMLLVLPGRPAGRTSVVAASAIIFLIGCIGHEANTLLLPAYLAVALVSLKPDLRSWPVLTSAFLLVLLVGLSLAYALTHVTVTDPSIICAPLLERQIDPKVCSGAIAYLAHDPGYALSAAAGQFNAPMVLNVLLCYGVSAAPILYLIGLHRNWPTILAVFLLFALPLIPLYVIAVDWGRWMVMHMSTFSIFLIAAVQAGTFTLRRTPDLRVLMIILLSGLVWGPDHGVGGIEIGGLAATAVEMLHRASDAAL
jgi:hypothetical protein